MEESTDSKDFLKYLQTFKEEMDADIGVNVDSSLEQSNMEFQCADAVSNMHMVDDAGSHVNETREEKLFSELITCLEDVSTVVKEEIVEPTPTSSEDYSMVENETVEECSFGGGEYDVEVKSEPVVADDASVVDILGIDEPSVSSGISIEQCINSSVQNVLLGSACSVDSCGETSSMKVGTDPGAGKTECTIDCYISRKEFFFESDHPALKMNSDYRKLLYVVLELEAKRAKAIRDLECLREIKNRALADPIGFAARLQGGEDLGIPTRQKIPEIPAIDWNKYAITSAECGLSKRQLTRHSAKSGGTDLISLCSGSAKACIGRPVTRPGGTTKGKKSRQDSAKATRMSQPWTAEEQKKLEELLVKYPPEDIESRRWEKIANELENRTPTQVASRVQKYFIKLLKAGMPIPGRQPNSSYLRKPRRQVLRHQPSTFFPSFVVPVHIDDNDMKLSSFGCAQPPSDDEDSYDVAVSDDDDIPPEARNTPEYIELMTVKKAMRRKRNQYISSTAQHVGYKCDRCGCDPIIGVRWHCIECPSSMSTDLCGDCVDSTHETEYHSAVHKLEAVRYASSVTGFDSDYSFFVDGEYNYLDPNYIPAM